MRVPQVPQVVRRFRMMDAACKRCGFEEMVYGSCCAACGYDPRDVVPSFDPEVPALFDGPWGSAERGPFARRR